MATLCPPTPVALFCGILTGFDDLVAEAIARMEDAVGAKTDRLAGPFDFGQTAYYEEAMGRGIERWFVTWPKPVDPSFLVEVKLRTQEVERTMAERHAEACGVERPVNLDPGYIESSKVILASAKNFSHRIYLGQGVYGEATLQYRKDGRFTTLPWTFPDFVSERYHAFLLETRRLYRLALTGCCAETGESRSRNAVGGSCAASGGAPPPPGTSA